MFSGAVLWCCEAPVRWWSGAGADSQKAHVVPLWPLMQRQLVPCINHSQLKKLTAKLTGYIPPKLCTHALITKICHTSCKTGSAACLQLPPPAYHTQNIVNTYAYDGRQHPQPLPHHHCFPAAAAPPPAAAAYSPLTLSPCSCCALMRTEGPMVVHTCMVFQ